ncbi:hypothetical protein HAHE_03140 [Haloferula helveola]|uniref:Uncharacterized protein n=1 Tax=Haloferula helveola TaxID=490095 RepID=A0ABM7RFC4_9BACT|nr:hypothetical protein HAHE_03140 [Haloferula helveola]
MNDDPILPRPVPMSDGLLRKWLGAGGADKLRDAGELQSGPQPMVEAVENAIRQQYPDGNFPPAEELLDLERLTPEEEEGFRIGVRALEGYMAGLRDGRLKAD